MRWPRLVFGDAADKISTLRGRLIKTQQKLRDARMEVVALGRELRETETAIRKCEAALPVEVVEELRKGRAP